MFDPHAAEGLGVSYELRLGEHRFRTEVVDGRLEVEHGDADRPDAVIEADPAVLAALVYGGRDLVEVLRSGEVRIEGDESAVKRFLTHFPLPEPAAPAAGA